STDKFNLGKNKECINPYDERAAIVSALKPVDQVFPEENWEQKVDDVVKYNADVFVIGDDWVGKFDFLEKYCQVRYLTRTPEISTTKRKKLISSGRVKLSDWLASTAE